MSPSINTPDICEERVHLLRELSTMVIQQSASDKNREAKNIPGARRRYHDVRGASYYHRRGVPAAFHFLLPAVGERSSSKHRPAPFHLNHETPSPFRWRLVRRPRVSVHSPLLSLG